MNQNEPKIFWYFTRNAIFLKLDNKKCSSHNVCFSSIWLSKHSVLRQEMWKKRPIFLFSCWYALYLQCGEVKFAAKTYWGKRLAWILPMNLDTSSFWLGKKAQTVPPLVISYIDLNIPIPKVWAVSYYLIKAVESLSVIIRQQAHTSFLCLNQNY